MLTRRTFSLALVALSTSAWAKPSQRMRIVVPYPAGGPLDASARVLSEAMKNRFGRVLVDNRAGAAGARGMLEVKNAKPDGMTLAVGALATLVVNPILFNDLPYKPGDFRPVCLLSNVPNVLVMSPESMKRLCIKDARDLIDYIKENPSKLNCASGGTGSAGHILNALFNSLGLKTVHVPYAGAAAAQLSVLSGETDFMFDNFASAKAAIADGRLKVLAQTAALAHPDIPAPTLTSLGIKCDISTWFGLVAPKATSPEKCEALYLAVKEALSSIEVAQKFAAVTGGGSELLSPTAFTSWIEAEQVKYHTFLKTLTR